MPPRPPRTQSMRTWLKLPSSFERQNGSSVPAIAKYLAANYKLPDNFKKILSTQLKISSSPVNFKGQGFLQAWRGTQEGSQEAQEEGRAQEEEGRQEAQEEGRQEAQEGCQKPRGCQEGCQEAEKAAKKVAKKK